MSKTDLSFLKDRRIRWIVLLLIVSAPLVGWWAYGLFDLDEGFYAAVTGSMIRHHEWVTPLYNGKPWFEKPILIYWLSKPSIMLFGPWVGPRFPSVLCTIGTYAVVASFLRKHLSAMAAVMSMFILGSSLLVVIVGRMMMTDASLLFFFTLAMLTYFESLVGDPKWKLVTSACLGLAVLAKGPLAIILFLLIVVSNAIWNRNVAARRNQIESFTSSDNPMRIALVWFFGAIILFAVIGAWYMPAYLANGQVFVQKFLIDQNIGRFTGGDQAHTMPFLKSFWFYIPILLVGMFPWILFLPKAWPKAIMPSTIQDSDSSPYVSQSKDSGGFLLPAYALQRLCAVWIVVVFLFFTLSGAKLPHYVLPCAPPIAILVAAYLAERWKSLDREQVRPKLFLTVGWLISCWIIVQVGFEYWYVKSGQLEAHQMARWLATRDNSSPILAYQLPRRSKSLGTGKPELQETSLPSLSFYVDRDLLESDSLQPATEHPTTFIFTRVGRVTKRNQDLLFEGPNSFVLTLELRGRYYQIYKSVEVDTKHSTALLRGPVALVQRPISPRRA